jgi:hypothetical protein
MSVRGEAEIRQDAYVWGLVAELHTHLATLEGMKATNAAWAVQGKEPQYTEDDFNQLAELIRGVSTALFQA